MNYNIDIQHLLPINTVGSENDASSFVICSSQMEAFDQFQKLSGKLLEINNWKVNAKKNPTEFYMYRKENEKSAVAKLNDYVKIKMPAPENKLGNGYDWVVINKIDPIEQKDLKALLLQMKPHSSPESAKGSIAHFYKEDATNTFILAKKDKMIQFSIHGRNEIPNTKKVGLLNALRNFFVASGGIFGGSKIQWEDFTKEFISN